MSPALSTGKEHLHGKDGSALGAMGRAAGGYSQLGLTAPFAFWIKPFATCSGLEIIQRLFSWESRNIKSRMQHLKADTTEQKPQLTQGTIWDTLAFQPVIIAALLHWRKGENQVSIIVFLYGKRILFKCCNKFQLKRTKEISNLYSVYIHYSN